MTFHFPNVALLQLLGKPFPLGRGISHPPDDTRPDNPPSNPELLAFLEQELVTSQYDLKQLTRLILRFGTHRTPESDETPAVQLGQVRLITLRVEGCGHDPPCARGADVDQGVKEIPYLVA